MTPLPLRPGASFVGVIDDPHGTIWTLHVAQSPLRGCVYVIAISETHAFGGDLILRRRFFDDLTPNHNQRRPFLDRIGAHLLSLARFAGRRERSECRALALLADVLAENLTA